MMYYEYTIITNNIIYNACTAYIWYICNFPACIKKKIDSLVVIWEGLTAAVVMSSTIFRIHKKPSSLHGADYKRNEEFHHVV